jgi:peptidoglycan/xylan/chitin deacetylase (PgdA/CDA1 family)
VNSKPVLAIKIDVDTDRGTQLGVPALVKLLKTHHIPATFFFSLGPDNTGRALKRLFRPGFLQKVLRTRVVSVYGWRTLLNGILWPGPHIGKRRADILQTVAAAGFETGIHCYDHIRWQDGLATMTLQQVEAEFTKARDEFARIFNRPAFAAAAAGWQANANSLSVYDDARLIYASDCRGKYPFFPQVNAKIYQTLQIPTTLPTLDELLGFSDYPLSALSDYYFSLLQTDQPNVMTIHAELEGMAYLDWFDGLLGTLKAKGVEFVGMADIAKECFQRRECIPVCSLVQGEMRGRSGALAIQKT